MDLKFKNNLPIVKNKEGLAVDWGALYDTEICLIKDGIEEIIYVEKGKNKDIKVTLKSNGNSKVYQRTVFKKCKISSLFIDKYKYRYNVGDIVSSKNSKYKILKQSRTEYNLKCYDIKCLNCGTISYNYKELELGKHSCGNCRNDFRLNIGTVYKTDKVDMTITDRFLDTVTTKSGTRAWRKYKYTCNKCGYTDGVVEELKLINYNRGCPCCCHNPQVVVPEINSIKAKAPWMMKLGVSEEDSIKYTPCSNKKIEVTCPDCGRKKNISIDRINKYKSISCTCGDGFSYPEKFMANTLIQLDVDFEPQLTKKVFKWCEDYRYDFYLPDYNMIIETHGEQHYRESNFKRTLEEEQSNDRLKKELAFKNGINTYIEIDCRESVLEYIKNSIHNSKLNELFDLTNIDWLKCEEYALSNLVKEVCEYWNNKEEWETTTDVGRVFNLSKATIREYAKSGTKLNWCSYDAKEEINKTLFKSKIKQ